MTIEQAIEQYDEYANVCMHHNLTVSQKEFQQLATWLRELQERRKERDYWQEKAHSYEQTIHKLTDAISKQPEIVRCKNCIYYDPPHVENNGVRYEYAEMPADAFDVLGTGLVTTEYGINIGGRCCRDYNTGYDDDKRVFVPENNFCGRAERRTE